MSVTMAAGKGAKRKDVEELFETTPVEDIRVILTGLEKEMDSKREELRTLVGERYRDLMEAANTIAQMKDTCEDVVNSIAALTGPEEDVDSFIKDTDDIDDDDEDNINHRFPHKPFGRLESTSSEVVVLEENELVVASQAKLLMDCSEMMWASVDCQDFLSAAQIFLLARHTHTNLGLTDVSSFVESSVGGTTAADFPLVSRQWDAVQPFKESIIEDCRKALRTSSKPIASIPTRSRQNSVSGEGKIDPTSDSVAALAALALLQPGSDSGALFREFLQLREEGMKSIVSAGGVQAQAKIKTFLSSVVSCIQVVEAGFLDNKLSLTVEDVCSMPVLEAHNTSSMGLNLMAHLPSIVRGFKPSLVTGDSSKITFDPDGVNLGDHNSGKLSQVSSEVVSKECTSFLDRLHEAVRESGILAHVNSIRDLGHIRKSVHEYMRTDKTAFDSSINDSDMVNESVRNDGWEGLAERVLGRRINLWEEFFRGIFRDRLEVLVTGQVDKSIMAFEDAAKTLPSENISDFTWSEDHLIHQPQNPSNSNKGNTTTITPLSLKAHAFSPKVVEVCQALDRDFETLLNELSHYLGEDKKEEKKHANNFNYFSNLSEEGLSNFNKEPFSQSQDSQALWDFTTKTIQSCFEKAVEHLAKQENVSINDQCLTSARLCMAAQQLTPSLKRCVLRSAEAKVHQSQLNNQNDWMMSSTKLSDEDWRAVKALLESEVTRAYSTWIEGCPVASAKATLETGLSDSLRSHGGLMNQILSTTWESVEISEEGLEEGQKVTSTIRVPSTTSLGLSNALNELCCALLASGLHSASSAVQESACALSLEALTRVYKDCLQKEDNSVRIGQNMALQLHFDVEFLSSLKGEPGPEDESLLQTLEAHIDPFDMSVFRPYLHSNVRRAVSKNQTLLSPLISHGKNALFTSTRGAVSASGGPTNAMLISESAHRFPLLPIVTSAPGSQSIGSREQQSVAQRAASMVSSSLVDTTGPGVIGSSSGLRAGPTSSKSNRKRDKSPAVTKAAGSFFEAMSTSWFGSMK